MADDKDKEEGGEEKAAEPKASGGKRKLFIAVGALLVLVLAIGVPLFFVLGGKSKPKVEEPNVDVGSKAGDHQPEGFDDQEAPDEGEEPLGTFFPLDTFVVNLAKGGYVRVTFQIEFNAPDVPGKFLRRVIPVRDSIIFLLGSYSAEDITSSNGKRELKVKVKELVNEAMRKEVAKEVYLTQFIVQ